MAIVRMQKVAIIAHHALREEMIEMLHDEGVIEVRPAGNSLPVDHTEVAFREAEVDFAITALKEFATKDTIEASNKPSSVTDIMHSAKHTDVLGIVKSLHTLESTDAEAQRRIQELEAFTALYGPWRALPFALNETNSTESSVRILGTLPVSQESVLSETLSGTTKRFALQKITQENGMGYFMAYVWKKDRGTFEEVATSAGWTTATLPPLSSPPAHALEEALVEKRTLEHTLRQNKALRTKLSAELPDLLRMKMFFGWLNGKQQVREYMASTEATVTLLGWIPAARMEILESHLQKISPAIAVLKIKPDEGEEAPILLKNNKLIAPFESVTSLYGLPLPSEMDPTAALSPFFALYFALCLTDAGYGLVLALIFGAYLWKTKKSIAEARLWWLLFISGIVTFFVSIPFGGWFGMTPEQAPSFMTHETENGMMFWGQLWNLSQQDGISFLQNLSIALGLTHIFFGVFLAGWHKWIHGQKASAFWEHFTAHILVGTVIVNFFLPSQAMTFVLYAAIALFVWGKGYGNPWFLRPIMGVLGVANFAIGLLSNGLSYLRILALGLVTGAIALAVNQVAIELGNLFPAWLGIPVTIIILLGGHLVSIALNTLGSFIHSGRLQFIEFFSQFFEGGGQPFAPFKRSTHS